MLFTWILGIVQNRNLLEGTKYKLGQRNLAEPLRSTPCQSLRGIYRRGMHRTMARIIIRIITTRIITTRIIITKARKHPMTKSRFPKRPRLLRFQRLASPVVRNFMFILFYFCLASFIYFTDINCSFVLFQLD